ncbi:MAG: RloB family protein [Caldilineaceae bacterium]
MSRKARNVQDLQRRSPKRDPYERILIVCEGSKTEPNYFREVIDALKLNTANVEVDGDSDPSPKSVVRHAKKRYREDTEFDRIYCVIDKDEHSTYQEATAEIQAAKPIGVFHIIPSVPCFEYWLLLHFIYTTRPYARSENRSPGDHVFHELKQHLPDYEKGSKMIYRKIMPQTDRAISHAKRANAAANKAHTDNPSTQVYVLVEYLRGLKEPKKRST